jgi:hypothetical protein
MAKDNEPPVGERFDHVYVERGKPIDDSERLRRRMHAAFRDLNLLDSAKGLIGSRLEAELGIDMPTGWAGYIFEQFFVDAELRDVLSGVTIIWRGLRYQRGQALEARRRAYLP